MTRLPLAILLLLSFVSVTTAQLPRVGATISRSERLYFGIARRSDNLDSMKVVRTAGITLLGMRRDTIVDSVVFAPDEVPNLERYLQDYELLLSSENDLFISDTTLSRLLDRLAPRQFYVPGTKVLAIRLSNGSVKTGVPLAATENKIFISNDSVYRPERDLSAKNFTCIPVSLIETMTSDIGVDRQRWYVVRGDGARFRSALLLACSTTAYVYAMPPEAIDCVPEFSGNVTFAAPISHVAPRSTNWSISGFAGVLFTQSGPGARVTRSFGVANVQWNALLLQPLTYSSGIEAALPISKPFDVGLRMTANVQPSTINDSTRQHSLGFDSYGLQLLGAWQIAPIDMVGYSKIGVSTTLAVGPSLLAYRGRTVIESKNRTTTGTGVAIDATWSMQLMYALSKNLACGVRGFLSYQLGLSSSIDDITVPTTTSRSWVASFSITNQTATFAGIQCTLSYTFE